ncbi:CYTH domain-containing protein [Candidatus Azambacteria bacterium]|nr:CYTH domain-containing protein [Candidatus Azambacteria bacterium]MBI3685158.1 CYTH domain-containing protein [Candidatus Azambacteria bacterium]
MIEVERDFYLETEDKKRLIKGAEFLGTKTFTDVYYDTADYSLTQRDFWLRTRDGILELKAPLNRERIDNRQTDQYRELESDESIARELELKIKTTLSDALADAGYKPFATLITERENYKIGDFLLCFDKADFGYTAFEVELMVNGVEEIPAAEARILVLAKKYDISLKRPPRGKVVEYIFRTNPMHYRKLVASGVVSD